MSLTSVGCRVQVTRCRLVTCPLILTRDFNVKPQLYSNLSKRLTRHCGNADKETGHHQISIIEDLLTVFSIPTPDSVVGQHAAFLDQNTQYSKYK